MGKTQTKSEKQKPPEGSDVQGALHRLLELLAHAVVAELRKTPADESEEDYAK